MSVLMKENFEQIVFEKQGIPRWKVNYMLFLLCLAYMFDYSDRMVISSVVPFIKESWDVSDQSLGSLTSIVSFFIALFVLPLSLVVDRWSRKKMVAIMVFFWSLATLGSALAQNFNQLVISRALTGLGEAGYVPAAVASIAALYPIEKRAKTIGVWEAFAPLGAALGFIIGGIIGKYYGWRHALGVLAIPGLILSVFLWFSYDYKTVRFAKKREERWKSFKAAIASMLKTKTLWFVYFAFAMNYAVSAAILFWLPSYLNRFYGIDEKLAGNYSGGMALLALIGAPLGGLLADIWQKKKKNARMAFSAYTALFGGVFLAFALFFKGSVTAIPFFVLYGIFSIAYLAPASAVVQDVVHPGVRALAYGVNVVCMNIFGPSWSPIAIGRLSDNFGLDKAFWLLPVLSFIAFVIFKIGSFFYVKDMENFTNENNSK
jgi:MFS family permease